MYKMLIRKLKKNSRSFFYWFKQLQIGYFYLKNRNLNVSFGNLKNSC